MSSETPDAAEAAAIPVLSGEEAVSFPSINQGSDSPSEPPDHPRFTEDSSPEELYRAALALELLVDYFSDRDEEHGEELASSKLELDIAGAEIRALKDRNRKLEKLASDQGAELVAWRAAHDRPYAMRAIRRLREVNEAQLKDNEALRQALEAVPLRQRRDLTFVDVAMILFRRNQRFRSLDNAVEWMRQAELSSYRKAKPGDAKMLHAKLCAALANREGK